MSRARRLQTAKGEHATRDMLRDQEGNTRSVRGPGLVPLHPGPNPTRTCCYRATAMKKKKKIMEEQKQNTKKQQQKSSFLL